MNLRKTHAKTPSREEETKESKGFSSPDFLRTFAPSRETSPVSNRRLTADSPELLAIIKQEGEV